MNDSTSPAPSNVPRGASKYLAVVSSEVKKAPRLRRPEVSLRTLSPEIALLIAKAASDMARVLFLNKTGIEYQIMEEIVEYGLMAKPAKLALCTKYTPKVTGEFTRRSFF